MKTPLVSIIMPTHNRGHLLKYAIESVLSQTYQNFELIIVDDGSEDDTDKIIKVVNDNRLISFKINHSGVVKARNFGINKSKGQIIAYLDSDNRWYSDFLRVMTEELKDPYVLIYSAQNLLLRKNLNINSRIIARVIRREEYNSGKILKGNYIDLNSVVHKRSVFSSIGVFDTKLKTMSDWDFLTRVIIRYPFQVKFIDQVLSEYYYTLDKKSTLTSSYVSEEAILKKFGLMKSWGTRKIILNKIQESLNKLS